MRIVFSRKGFDSSYGGGASPILPDGTMITFPIPEKGSLVRYADLQTPRGSLLQLMLALGVTRYRENKQWCRLDPQSEAHLDPDIHRDTSVRHDDWRPVFGQCDAAQTVLANRGVSKGDLFIYYGTFRRTETADMGLKYVGKAFHAIFGYMLVGEIIRVNGQTSIPWCASHPHLVNRNRKNNTLYVAAMSLGSHNLPGAAMLRFDEQRVLSKSADRISLWKLPRFLHPALSQKAMSNHRLEDWSLEPDAAFLQTKSPGQEYVVEATAEMREWALKLVAA